MDTHIEMMVNKSRKDPAWFIETVFGQYPCRRDSAICHALTRDKIVTVPRIREEVELSVRLAFYFLYSFSQAKVLVVSSTQSDTLGWFKEFQKAYWSSFYEFGGELHEDRFIISPDWFVMGLHPDLTQLEQVVGFMAENILVIFNGSENIPTIVQQAAMSHLSCGNGKVLSLGQFDPREIYEKN